MSEEATTTRLGGALTIAGRELRSRLLLGTGGFASLDLLAAAIAASGSELVTVALRRIDPASRGSLVGVLDQAGLELLPNTAGCYTARDAVRTARLAREAFETDWVKLEVIGDERTLLPDAPELLLAAEQLGRIGEERAIVADHLELHPVRGERLPRHAGREDSVASRVAAGRVREQVEAEALDHL